MKNRVTILTIFLVFLGVQVVFANSVTYRISATIPAIVGVNVPALEDKSGEQTIRANTELEKQVDHVVRNNQKILMETIVAK